MKQSLKKSGIFLVLAILLTALIYVSDISNLPDNVILFEGEALKLNTILGVDLETTFASNPNIERIENNETVTVTTEAQDIEDLDSTGTINLDVKLLGKKVKEISVNVIENRNVVPIGEVIGVKLYTNGVLVVGMSEISGVDSNKYKPYEGTGIEEGDIIVEINENEVTCTNELTTEINNSKGKDMSVTYIRNRRGFKYNNKGCKNKQQHI